MLQNCIKHIVINVNNMTVKQLISKLKKLPPNLEVYSADHDHGEFETNTILNYCDLIDKKDMSESVKEQHNNDPYYECFNNTPKRYVVVRP